VQLTLARYNIRESPGLEGRRDAERILTEPRDVDADMIASQEADRRFGGKASG